jgi:hypothetical protein
VDDLDVDDVAATAARVDGEEERRRQRAVRDDGACLLPDRTPQHLVRNVGVRQARAEQHADHRADELRQLEAQHRIVTAAADAEHAVAAVLDVAPRGAEIVERDLPIAVDQEHVVAARGRQPRDERAAVALIRLVNHAHAVVVGDRAIEDRTGIVARPVVDDDQLGAGNDAEHVAAHVVNREDDRALLVVDGHHDGERDVRG